MQLTQIRDSFWINAEHVTNVWIASNEPLALYFQLSSDGPGEENVLRTAPEIAAFCRAVGLPPRD